MMFLSANQCQAKDAYSVLRISFCTMCRHPRSSGPRFYWWQPSLRVNERTGVEASLGVEPLSFVSHPLFPRVEYGIVTTETFPRHLTVLETAS
jgi:hypothetical protein